MYDNYLSLRVFLSLHSRVVHWLNIKNNEIGCEFSKLEHKLVFAIPITTGAFILIPCGASSAIGKTEEGWTINLVFVHGIPMKMGGFWAMNITKIGGWVSEKGLTSHQHKIGYVEKKKKKKKKKNLGGETSLL